MNKLSRPGKPARHINYANVVATMALFIALGGISWAAATAPNNSVAAKSIKKNAVTNSKIKNNAVTSRKIKSSSVLSSDVKNDALTGEDINEGTLATVPSASTATDQFNAAKAVRPSASNNDPAVARAAATEIPLASHGAISVYAKCFHDTDGNTTYYEVYSRTTANGAIQAGYSISDELYGNPAALNTTTLEVDRQLMNDSASANNASYDYANEASIIGPDGKGLFLSVQGYAAEGNLPDPSPLLPNGDSCVFHYRGSNLG